MLPVILVVGLAAAGIGVAAAVVTFWDEIKSFLKSAYQKLKKAISAAIVGFSTYLKTGKIFDSIQAAYKFYHKNDKNQWQETIVTRAISESEVPEHIRAKLDKLPAESELDISNELELELTA